MVYIWSNTRLNIESSVYCRKLNNMIMIFIIPIIEYVNDLIIRVLGHINDLRKLFTDMHV